jgi:DeoR/GlpR family transcriptional regulator of sugar metabolism
MLAEQRRLKILELLREEGSARVRDLSKTFSVSEPTIRQDLEKLEAGGTITREHGGAFLKSVPQQVQAMSLEHLSNMEKKRAIAREAAKFVDHGETIILDAGSTTTEMVDSLREKQNLKVMTNALNIVLRLGAVPGFTVFSSSGQFKPPTLSLTGEKAAEFFSDVYASKLFLATAGISFDAGLTYPGFNDLYVKKAMIKAAKEVFLLADSTKIGKVSLASLGGLDLIHTFITDTSIADEDRRRFEDMGVKVILAE